MRSRYNTFNLQSSGLKLLDLPFICLLMALIFFISACGGTNTPNNATGVVATPSSPNTVFTPSPTPTLAVIPSPTRTPTPTLCKEQPMFDGITPTPDTYTFYTVTCSNAPGTYMVSVQPSGNSYMVTDNNNNFHCTIGLNLYGTALPNNKGTLFQWKCPASQSSPPGIPANPDTLAMFVSPSQDRSYFYIPATGHFIIKWNGLTLTFDQGDYIQP